MGSEVKVSELRQKSDAELNVRKDELKKSIFACRSEGVGSDEKKQCHKKRNCCKELARILTIKREREFDEIPSGTL